MKAKPSSDAVSAFLYFLGADLTEIKGFIIFNASTMILQNFGKLKKVLWQLTVVNGIWVSGWGKLGPDRGMVKELQARFGQVT